MGQNPTNETETKLFKMNKTMDEKIQAELKELQNLKEAGNLDETQINRAAELEAWFAAEQTAESKAKEAQSLLAQKDHFRTKVEELEKEKENWKKPVEKPANAPSMDAMEVANLSVVFNGLDTTQRAKLIKEVKANGLEVTSNTLEEAKKSEDFQLWDSSYQAKILKEKAPVPSTTQPGEGKPKEDLEILAEGRGELDDFLNENSAKSKVIDKMGLSFKPERRSKKDTIPLSN